MLSLDDKHVYPFDHLRSYQEKDVTLVMGAAAVVDTQPIKTSTVRGKD